MKREWEHKKLGDVCLKITDGTHSTPTYTKDGVPFLSVKNLTQGFIDFSDTRFISREEHDFLTRRCKPVRNDILYTKVGTTGIAQVVDVDNEFSIFVSVALLKIKHEVIFNRYLEYFLNSPYAREQAQKRTRGMANRNLVISDIKEIDIHYPASLPEQQRIVGILDQSFEGIATAKANAEKNLQNARALLESHLQSVFTQRGKGWVEKTFEELIESNVIGLTKSSREQGDDKSWPYVKMNNITRDNRFDFSSFTSIDATDDEVRKFQLKNGDFLFNTRNSFELVGKSCIYETDSHEVVLFNNNIMRVRFVASIDAEFVLLAFSSKGISEALSALKSGTTNVSAIYFKDLKSLVVPIPPIATQKKIASELNALRDETQHLESIYQQKLVALEALKKSLLNQAFTGQL